jgi:TolB-like protein
LEEIPELAPVQSDSYESREGDSQKTNSPGRHIVTPATSESSGAKLIVTVLCVLVLAAAVGGYSWIVSSRITASSTKGASIAVLPFADLSPGKDQEYFSDGLAEELINDLAKVPNMQVVARSSSFQFKGKNEDLRVVGRKLNVANILEGSVRREGDRVRITAELIKADDGFQLWSATYDRTINDVFNVQDEIARSATEALQVKLVGSSVSAVVPRERTPKSEAYQAYLQAQAFFGSDEDKGNLERALASTDEAIKLDPNYAPAWALRSYVRIMIAASNVTDSPDGYARAREDAKRAIALDPRLATGYLALGWIQMMYDWDWEQAETSLKKAAEFEPGSVEVLRYRSSLFRVLGCLDEAIELYNKVIALDPLRARSYSSLGSQLYFAGRFDEANAMLQKALELNPQKGRDHFTRGRILIAQGRPQQALTEIEQETDGNLKLFGEALAYHSLGRPQDSDGALQKLIATNQQEGAYPIAAVYAFRAEPFKAFEWLDRAYSQRDVGLMFVKIDPLLKSLREDPRYADLLKKMHLPA